VILIVIDGLRADHLTPFGYSRDTSPFLDEMAASGVLFENTISQSSGTKTSVASLLTSLYPEAHGVRGVKDVLPDSIRLLPEVLRDHGYRTFAIHGNPWLEERFGFNQGFDEFRFTHWYKDTFDAQMVNEQALQWVDEKQTPPFFLYLHYMDVHSPWKPPGDFDRFGPEAVDQYDGSSNTSWTSKAEPKSYTI
jgi:arylsulfatase A-like enzyme